jgi:hypothetical protein
MNEVLLKISLDDLVHLGDFFLFDRDMSNI